MTASTLPEPTERIDDRREMYISYLDHFRETAIALVGSLTESARRSSLLASGWTPLSLLRHVSFVERRWLEWGFEGQIVDAPWADRRDQVFVVDDTVTFDELVHELTARGATTRAIIRAHELHDIGAPSERWDGNNPANLERILLHLVQEYARHLGHLDIVVEMQPPEHITHA